MGPTPMETKAPAAFVEEQEWIDAPAGTVQTTIDRAFEALGGVDGPVHQALNGDWYGHPLHPAVVVAPIGAFTMASALDALSSHDSYEGASEALIGIGLATSVVAALTGATQWHQMKDAPVKRVGLVHAAANTVALGLYGASLILRKGDNRSLGKALAAVGLSILTYSAYLGGHMTYKRKAGVE